MQLGSGEVLPGCPHRVLDGAGLAGGATTTGRWRPDSTGGYRLTVSIGSTAASLSRRNVNVNGNRSPANCLCTIRWDQFQENEVLSLDLRAVGVEDFYWSSNPNWRSLGWVPGCSRVMKDFRTAVGADLMQFANWPWNLAFRRWLLLTVAAGAILGPVEAARAADRQKQVLVLYSTRRDAQIAVVGDRELPRILEKGLPQGLDYYSEYIDRTRSP